MNHRDIDLKSLRLFASACELQNMRQVALREHLEPSAVSKRLSQLEAQLGLPLLERSRRGVRATAAGEALLEHARSVLFSIDRIGADMTAFQGGLRAQVRIVASMSAIGESLLDDLAAFMREPANSGIRVHIEECYSRDVVKLVRNGSAALGVCWDQIDFGELEHLAYRRDRLGLAVHESSPLARRRSIRFEDSLDLEHVGLQPDTAVYSLLQRAAVNAGRPINYRAVVSNFDAAFRVVAANLGVSVVPVQIGQACAKLHGIRVVPLTNDWARRRFAVSFRHLDELSPASRRVAEHLSAAAAAARAA